MRIASIINTILSKLHTLVQRDVKYDSFTTECKLDTQVMVATVILRNVKIHWM